MSRSDTETATLEPPPVEMALTFYRAILGDEPTEFRLIHPHPRRGMKKTLHLWGYPENEAQLGALAEYNAEGYGVYVVINRCAPEVEQRCDRGQGARDEDITGIRAVYVDLDHEAEAGSNLAKFKTAPLPPSGLVCTGLEYKLQAYWSITDLPPADFERVQKALITHFDSDKAVCNPAHVMRLPGFINTKPKYDSPPVRLLEAPGYLYTRHEFLEAFGIPLEPPESERDDERQRVTVPPDAGHLRKYALAALQREADALAAMKRDSGRNNRLNRAAWVLGGFIPHGLLERHEIEDALMDAARACGLVDDDGERHTRSTLESGLSAAPLRDLGKIRKRAQRTGKTTIGGKTSSAPAEDAANDTTDDEEPWREIVPLSDPNPPAPPLPPELIPAALRAWLVDVAERLCVPVEIPAAAAIVAAGGTLGRGVGIYPQRYDDWLVYANLWGGTIAKPGMMKSPLIAEATKGARRLEAAAAEAFEEAAAAHDVKRERLELEIEACRKRMKDAIGKGIDTSALEADMIALKQEANAVPAAPRRLVVQDSTVEKLGELLQANPRGLLLLRDELAGWLRSLERLGREGDREFYLETWSGDGVYTFDRIKRGTVRIPHLCLSVFGGIQPGKLKRYIQDATTGGEGADGLLQRLQVVVWPESLGEWVNTDRTPDRAAWVRARKVFDALAEYDAAALGLEADEDGRAGLRFSAEAQEVFYEWRGELEQRVRGGELDSTPAFASHLSKYRSLMPGLALLFHLIGLADGTHDNTAVGREDARLAADWCDYLETHARRVYHGELERVALACHAIVEKIDAGEIKHEMKVRDIYRAEWEGLSDRVTVLEALGDLEESNHLRVVEAPTGGRPTAVIHLHPSLRA